MAFLVLRIAFDYKTFGLNPDYAYELQTLVNFYHGHGMSISSFHNTVLYQSPLFPSGMVLFLFPFYLITKNTLLSAFILKTTCFVFLGLFLKKILSLLRADAISQLTAFIFFAFAPFPFIVSSVVDFLPLVLCLWGFYFCLKYSFKSSAKDLATGIILLCISPIIKYSYLPFVLFPVCFYLFDSSTWTKAKFSVLFKMGLFTLVVFGVLYFINLSLVSSPQVDVNPGADAGAKGFHLYPGHLKRFDYFLLHFGIEHRLADWLVKLPVIGWRFYHQIDVLTVLRVLNAFIVLFTFVYFIRLKIRGSKPEVLSKTGAVSTAALILIMGFLSALSLKLPGETWQVPYWTLVEETRYYGPAIICTQLFLILILTQRNNEKNTRAGAMLLFKIVVLSVAILVNARFYLEMIHQNTSFYTYLSKYNALDRASRQSGATRPEIIFYDADVATQDYFILKTTGACLVAYADSTKKPNVQVTNLQQIEDHMFSATIQRNSSSVGKNGNISGLHYHADGSITHI